MTAPPSLATLPWPEVAALADRGAVLVVPVGSCEQHGHHLPPTTDADIAVALADGLGTTDVASDVVVAPPVTYGSSGEHDGFAGTLSIGREATRLLLVELARSARRNGFERVLLLSAHGGNAAPVAEAVAQLVEEGHDVRAWSPRFGGDAHAGRTETSLLLALRPDVVGPDRRAGATDPLTELLPGLTSDGVRAVSSTGVLGDPAGATAAEGRRLLDDATAELASFVAAWAVPRPSRSPVAPPPPERHDPAGEVATVGEMAAVDDGRAGRGVDA